MTTFDQELLAVIRDQPQPIYGVPLRQQIEARMLRPVSYGEVYAAAERLECAGLIRSWQGEATPQRGGRRKRYFQSVNVEAR